jgi:predicted secreted Zn-dependent protease
MRRLVLAAAMMAAGVALCEAKPISTTHYVYYPISGSSAADLYGAMISRGPHVNGEKAYAATFTNAALGRVAGDKNCKSSQYRLKFDFQIKLPQLRAGVALTGANRAEWNKFYGFVRHHEETHRSIWLACAQQFENRAAAIHASSCSDGASKALKLWTQIRNACNARHDAFDRAEQARLVRHSFVRLVISQKSNAVAVRKKKRRA